jgi:hypothetical protein
VFAVLGIAAIATGLVLAVLGSFAYLGAIAIGLFFVAAAHVTRAATSPGSRVAAVLALAAVAFLVVGQVATPLFYASWGLLAGSIALALVQARRRNAP